jgi:hypothetical protein
MPQGRVFLRVAAQLQNAAQQRVSPPMTPEPRRRARPVLAAQAAQLRASPRLEALRRELAAQPPLPFFG